MEYCTETEKRSGCMGLERLLSVWIVYPHDCVAGWELQFAATAQDHKRESDHMLLTQENIKIWGTVSTECVLLSHHYEVEKS